MTSSSILEHMFGKPSPPPLPPPPLKYYKDGSDVNTENENKLTSHERSNNKNKHNDTSLPSRNPDDSKQNMASTSKVTEYSQKTRTSSDETIILQKQRLKNESQISLDEDEEYVSPDVSRNDVIFYDDEECSDPDDEFTFTCCVPPLAPRYPPNPRPVKDWDPSVLPTGTNIPTSIGQPCKRCGKEVFLAELHLSSRGVYHTECYKCCLCGKPLDSWTVFEHKSELFCKGCYRRNFALHGCGFGIGAGVLQTP